jgi:aspartyl-tRNA(Asn)/glutamyl-tRNA(Gln) amidotransferase subunit A
MSDLTALSALELGRRVRAREVSAVEACVSHLERAREVNASLNAFLDLPEERLLEEARAIDARLAGGEELSPLAGVPVALKDNLVTKDQPTTAGSRILAGWRPPYDATVVTHLRRAGALPFGKTNCDEFAMGSSTEHSAFGSTRNPWDAARVPGGSSGGSAAAVASRAATLALGSDTGGSIRQPAALCGVVGMKPTYGRVSRFGLVAFASSLDQIGPFARSVEDAAALLAVIAGMDPLDSTCSEEPVPDLSQLGSDARRFRFGVPDGSLGEGVAADVRREVEAALTALERAGGERVEVALPHAEAAVATYYVVATAEASSNLARYDGVRFGHRAKEPSSVQDMMMRTREEGFGAEVKRRILLGTYVLSAGYHDAYYRRANRVRSLIGGDFDAAFASCDVVVTPTTPTTAFRLGEKTSDPLAMYLSDVFTVPANLAGLPGISLPSGLGDDAMPVGVQLVGRRFGERDLLDIAARLERELRFAEAHAPPR